MTDARRRFSGVEQYRITVPADYLAEVEARMVGHLAEDVHRAGLVFEDWPRIEKTYQRYDLPSGRFVDCGAMYAEYLLYRSEVVGRARRE